MSNVSIAQNFPNVSMYTCTGFSDFLIYLNSIIFNIVLVFFMFSRKRLATPFMIFKFGQIVYIFSLFNSLKDDCLSTFYESFDSFFFFRISRFIIGPLQTTYFHSFFSRFNQYDNMVFNIFDVYFYALLLGGAFFLVLCSYIFLIVTNSNNEEWMKKIRVIIDLFAYSVPIKLLEITYFPLSLYLLIGLYNSTLGDAGNIIITVVLILVTSLYLLVGIFLLSTYFSFYIKAPFIRKYGALYSHTNFINFSKIVKLLEEKSKDNYQAYRYLNLQRNHLNFEKILYFMISYILTYSQRSDGFVGLLIFMFVMIIFLTLFIFLRVKNDHFFYNPVLDYPNFVITIVFILNGLLLAVCTKESTSVQFTSVFLMLVNIGAYIFLLVCFCYEIWRSQDKDLLWKLKINRQDKINKKDEFIKLLQAEVIDERCRAIDRRAVTKTTIKERTNEDIRKSVMSRSNRPDQRPNENIQKSQKFDFVMKKYND
jgi:hypothetical protein